MAWMAQDNDQPVYVESGSGPGFTDLDGFGYIDFNASDMAMFCGHAHLTRLIRIWLANRGIWEALPGAGPTVPVPATPADVSRYVEAYRGLLAQLR